MKRRAVTTFESSFVCFLLFARCVMSVTLILHIPDILISGLNAEVDLPNWRLFWVFADAHSE
jgi:hypothetical protein